MSGCDYMNKSFTVAVEGEKISSFCNECKCGIVGTIYRVNGDTLCQECFDKRPSKIKSFLDGSEFHTSKDLLWDFVDTNTTGKPIHFTSKRAWKSHLKKLGMHDDVKICKSVENIPQQKFKKTDAKWIAHEMLSEAKRQGLYHKILKRG